MDTLRVSVVAQWLLLKKVNKLLYSSSSAISFSKPGTSSEVGVVCSLCESSWLCHAC